MTKTIRKKPTAKTRPGTRKSIRAKARPETTQAEGDQENPVSMKKSGYFITLEGGEGSGKSTQMRLVAEWLEGLGEEVLTTREPGGSPGAEAVRHVLLSGAAETLGSDMEAILFAAARADHVDTVIAPALARDQIVISDRFFDSTRVYQGVSGKASPEIVRKLESVACGSTWPDLTIIIDVKPEEGMKRAGKRRSDGENPDRFEKESLDLQRQRREAYLAIAKAEPERCVVVSGAGRAEAVFGRIRKQIEKRLEARFAAQGDVGDTKAIPPGIRNVTGKAAGKAGEKKPKLLPHKVLTSKRGSAKKTEQAG